MIKTIEKALVDKYIESSGLTRAEFFENGIVEVQLFDEMNDTAGLDESITRAISKIESDLEKRNNVIESNILQLSRFIKNRIAKSSTENKYSKIFFPEVIDDSSDDVVIKNGTIYGNTKPSKSTSYIEVESGNTTSIYYMAGAEVKGKLVNSKDGKLRVKPIEKLGKRSQLIMSIALNRIEAVNNIEINMDKSRSISVFYKEPGIDSFTFLSDKIGSIFNLELNKNITDLKIIIDITVSNSTEGEVLFESLKINRFALSEDCSVTLSTDIESNGSKIYIERCDSGNSNISYLVSTDKRPLKDATESPVSSYGIEDGEIYALNLSARITKDWKSYGLFYINGDTATIKSNKWTIFTGKNLFKEVYYGALGFYEIIAIYRDVFTIEVPTGKFIYINGKKRTQKIVMYAGVYSIKIPMDMFTLGYSMKFYSSINYDGTNIKLKKQDGTFDTILSGMDIFAQIQTTASNTFEETKGLVVVGDDGLVELETDDTVVYLGFEPQDPLIGVIDVKILFSKSSRMAEVNHIAIKTY